MTTDELKVNKAMEAWEAKEARYGLSHSNGLFCLELGGGKSIAMSGAYWIMFFGHTLEEVCEVAINKAPTMTMAEFRAEAMENMWRNA